VATETWSRCDARGCQRFSCEVRQSCRTSPFASLTFRLTVSPDPGREVYESAELLVGERFISLVGRFEATGGQCGRAVRSAAGLRQRRCHALESVISTATSWWWTAPKPARRHVQEAMSMLAPGRCLGTVSHRYTGRMFEKYGYGSYAYAKVLRAPVAPRAARLEAAAVILSSRA
jgi:hypothetical protein